MPKSAGRTAESDSRGQEHYRTINVDFWSGFIGAFPHQCTNHQKAIFLFDFLEIRLPRIKNAIVQIFML